MDLALVWSGILTFAIFAYVVLDGFDLGIGILFPALRSSEEKDTAMNSVAPVWDGNETWLVLGGGGLFAAFPLAYAIILPAVYAPLIAMLIGLVFRGVTFEFRWRDKAHEKYWDWVFFICSVIATFSQGIVLGAFIQGIQIEGRNYAGGWFDWLTPFSLLTGLSLVVGYALLGAGWLILKTESTLQARVYRLALPLAIGLFALIGIVSLWTPFLDPDIARRWFSWPNIALLWPVPFFVATLSGLLVWSIIKRKEWLPFPLTIALFLLSYIGLLISLFPYMVPRHLTLWDTAAPNTSLGFLLVGTSILIPVILSYTAHSYWVFRGKVEGGYHK